MFFKDLAKLSHGYKNICQTLAVQFQMAFANTLMNPSVHLSHEQVGPCDKVLVGSLDDVYADMVCTDMSLCKQDHVFVAK